MSKAFLRNVFIIWTDQEYQLIDGYSGQYIALL